MRRWCWSARSGARDSRPLGGARGKPMRSSGPTHRAPDDASPCRALLNGLVMRAAFVPATPRPAPPQSIVPPLRSPKPQPSNRASRSAPPARPPRGRSTPPPPPPGSRSRRARSAPPGMDPTTPRCPPIRSAFLRRQSPKPSSGGERFRSSKQPSRRSTLPL